ncbi:MAG TPA: flotillin domain-containing protein [Caldimonas sp.]|jgi:flotillin|nr:flotillin domain-containing protein [Caldimonas sp.]
MTLLAWLFGLIVAIVAIAVGVAFLNRFYRKTSRDVALIRTGFGGQKIVATGGTLALPFLHKVDEINMRTMRIEVSRTGAKSLITEDRMRVDVELEFYLRVQPTTEGVATAAQAVGSKSLSPDGVRNLLEGRFIDAIQATGATFTMDALHDKRAEFVRVIRESVRENLAQSGLQLESVSLTRMDQAAFASLDDNNAFNAVGLRKLAEIIATSKKKRAEIEADADVSVRQTQLEAIKQRLSLARQEEEAQIGQRLEIEKLKAASDADTARAREQATVASESARIDREQQTRLAEIQKSRELRKLEVDAQLNYETKKIDSSIALAQKHAEEARAQAQAELARTEIVLAQEQLQTERERAVAERSREIALKREEERGAVETSKAESETQVLLMTARAEASATTTRAEADRIRLTAQSEGTRAVIAAENSRTGELMRMQLEQHRLDRLPEIIAQMMKPAEKIDSIRIHNVTGFGGSSTPGGALGGGGDPAKAPVTQVMDSILGMALQLPALKSIGESIGVDLSAAVGPTSGGNPALGGPAPSSGDKARPKG